MIPENCARDGSNSPWGEFEIKHLKNKVRLTIGLKRYEIPKETWLEYKMWDPNTREQIDLEEWLVPPDKYEYRSLTLQHVVCKQKGKTEKQLLDNIDKYINEEMGL